MAGLSRGIMRRRVRGGPADRFLASNLESADEGQPRLVRWRFSTIEPFLGRIVLDAGAGVGTYSSLLVESGRHVAVVEPSVDCLEVLHHRFDGDERAVIMDCSIEDPLIAARAKELGVDSLICMNVLEHIEDESQALANLAAALPPDGRAVFLVPAHPWLYTPFDAAIGHFRRYRRRELQHKLSAAGLEPVRIFYFNAFGIPAWWLAAHTVLRGRSGSRWGNRFFDTLMPLFRAFDTTVLRGTVGVSLVAVCRRVAATVSSGGSPPCQGQG